MPEMSVVAPYPNQSIHQPKKLGKRTATMIISVMSQFVVISYLLIAQNQLSAARSSIPAVYTPTSNGQSVGETRRAIQVPDGLLFANELKSLSSTSYPPFSFSVASSSVTPTSKNAYHNQNHKDNNLRSSRLHPNLSIYPNNAHSQRLVEELENSSYYQTGIRIDPNHLVEYHNHPFDLMKQKRDKRDLQWSEEQLHDDDTSTDGSSFKSIGPDVTAFHPIRIHIETFALELQRTADNGAKIDFLKSSVLPRMRELLSSILSVVPVQGNLIISPAELAQRSHCLHWHLSRVPESHSSSGIADADLVLYVSGSSSTKFCAGDRLASAGACNFDQFDRPTAGAINFCLDQIMSNSNGTASESLIEYYVNVAIHEALHVLGMLSSRFRFFWNPSTGLPRTKRPFTAKKHLCADGVERTKTFPDENTLKFFNTSNGQRYASIITEKVNTVAKNHFNCQELIGAPLENVFGDECFGSHWQERMFLPEIMTPSAKSITKFVFSPLTLALLEDSGWYIANYSQSHVSPWGHGVGCDFLSSPCIANGGNGKDGTLPSHSKGFFCNKPSEKGCSPGHTHKMKCSIMDYSSRSDNMPPAEFQYFANPALGGHRHYDYCPVYGFQYSGREVDQLDCRIPTNQDKIDVFYSEEYGENSMCFETNSGQGRCYQAKCIYQDFNLQLQVDGKWYTCSEDFEKVKVSSYWAFGTTVTCPRLSSVCPDMFCPGNCAGRGICNFDHIDFNGIKRPRCECFDESVTSAGCSETYVLDEKYVPDGSSLTDSVFVDHSDMSTSSWVKVCVVLVLVMVVFLL